MPMWPPENQAGLWDRKWSAGYKAQLTVVLCAFRGVSRQRLGVGSYLVTLVLVGLQESRLSCVLVNEVQGIG